MSFADHFSTIASKYAAYRPTYPPSLVDALAARTQAHDVAWDVGCGTGQLTIALAEKFARVIATDPSQGQLDAATPHPRVEYRRAPAEASGLPDAIADLIVAAQAAHWFDWPRFIAEAGRVAEPGALVALVSYGNMLVDGDVGRVLDRYRDAVKPYWPPGREHVDNGYRDLVMPWTPVDAPAIDMSAEWSRDALVGYISTWSATVKRAEVHGTAAFDELRTALAAIWPDGETRTIKWPLAIRLARI